MISRRAPSRRAWKISPLARYSPSAGSATLAQPSRDDPRDPRAGGAIPQRRQLTGIRSVGTRLEHGRGQLGAGDQPVTTVADSDRALGVRPQRQAWHSEDRGLLLYAAGVGDHRGGAAHQGHELEVTEWLAHV